MTHEQLGPGVEAPRRPGTDADALRASEERLRAIVSSTTDAIVSVDGSQCITLFNTAAERLFGWPADEVLGQPLDLLLPARFAGRHARDVAAFGAAGATVRRMGRDLPVVGRRRDGAEFPVEATISRVQVDGELLYTAILREGENPEARRAAYEEAARSEKLRALGQMAGGIAHDLNQSLGLVAAYAHIARAALGVGEAPIDRPTLAEALGVMEQAALDGGETVKRLLLFGRGGVDGEAQPIDVAGLVADVAHLTAPRWRDQAQADGRAIQLRTDVGKALLVRGWPSALREALTNLVFNSVDALPEGGVIDLRARMGVDGTEVVVEVVDSGAGMSPEVAARVFEPFFTTKGDGGTGLGLAMVFGVVERHGGRITLDTAPGRGTTVRVVLPAVTHDEPVASARQRARTDPARLLVVDDELPLAHAAASLLRRDGHEVTIATSAEQAIALVDAGFFDCVFTDLGLTGGANGWAISEHVRATSPATPVVLVTGWGADINAAEARARGVSRVLPKPYRAGDLREALASVLRR